MLSGQNRDKYSLSYGCFDRRYWGWKMTDYPESTFQRNVYPLSLFLRKAREEERKAEIAVFSESVKSGIEFALAIQHADGSFDQAFPNEHSFGATAFLIHPLLNAYKTVQNEYSESQKNRIESGLFRAVDFLCNNKETHGRITNHLAGAALSLLEGFEFFNEPRFKKHFDSLTELIFSLQSPEGWFMEYEGADPGYQTLCLYYLTQVYRRKPDEKMRDALGKVIDFISWFAHPDGTFGGEYGSRRTSVFYPGGVALLAGEFSMAERLLYFMLESIGGARTVTLRDVDMGNLAPLLENYMAVLENPLTESDQPAGLLPWERGKTSRDFSHAGLHIRATQKYYAVIGTSNGGVIKVFGRKDKRVLYNDSGYAGRARNNKHITTQVTNLGRRLEVEDNEIVIHASFFEMQRLMPTPFRLVILRFLNLSLMRSRRIREWVKQKLAGVLMKNRRSFPLALTRVIKFEPEHVVLKDTLTPKKKVNLSWLVCGRPFVSIHMASAGYFEQFTDLPESRYADVKKLGEKKEVFQEVVI